MYAGPIMIAHLTWRGSNASACAIKETNFYILSSRCFALSSLARALLPGLVFQGEEGNQEHKHQLAVLLSTPGRTLYESKYNPPVIAQAPIATTYFGSGIWS